MIIIKPFHTGWSDHSIIILPKLIFCSALAHSLFTTGCLHKLRKLIPMTLLNHIWCRLIGVFIDCIYKFVYSIDLCLTHCIFRYEDFLRMNERSFCGIFRSDFFFFFFFDIVFSHNQKFLGSKQAPRYTGKRVILMRVLTRLECIYFHKNKLLS